MAGTDQAYDVSHGVFPVDILLHHTILVNPYSCQHVQCLLVTRVDAIENKAHHYLLPSWATLVPELCSLNIDDVTDVLHDAV